LHINNKNFDGLSKLLKDEDAAGSGLLSNDDFRRCISKAAMKVEDRELNTLIEELDSDKKG